MRSSHFILFCILSWILGFQGFAQKKMMLEENLKASSEELRIRFKGISALPKYYFGPYKVVDGKAGWTTTNTRQKMFSNTTKSTSKQKLSFILRGPGDSAIVNASIKGYYEEQHWFFGNFSTIGEDMETYTAYIVTTADSTLWEFAMINSINSGFKAGIKGDNDQLEIVPVMEFENGKKPLGGIGLVLGYTIYSQGLALASVQSMMYQAAWIRQDLPEDMKLRLAAVITSIMVFQQSSGN